LEEAGLKFDLLGKALFVSMAGFSRTHHPVGQGGYISPTRKSPVARSS